MLIFRGELMEPSRAHIPVDDHGLLYAAGAFETLRTYGGKCFLWEQHRGRLMRTLEALCIENMDTLLLADEERFYAAVRQLLAAEGMRDGVVRYTVSAGPGGFGLPHGAYRSPWDMLTARALPSPPSDAGVTLRVLQTRRDNGEQTPRGKSLAYLNSLFGWRELERIGEPGEQGVMLDVNGNVSEGVTCNVFWIQAGELRTPSLATGMLPGVHRAHLLSLAPQAGLRVTEGVWPPEAMAEAEAVGVINAATGPVRVRAVFDRQGNPLWQSKAVASAGFSRMVTAYHNSLPL